MNQMIKTNNIVTITTFGLAVSIFYHFLLMKMYFEFSSYPYSTFLFLPNDRFMDLLNPLQMTQDFSPYTNNGTAIPANYFPFTYLILYPFSIIPLHFSLIIFFLFFTISTSLTSDYFLNQNSASKYENRRNIFVLSFLTYPFLFTFDRGNIEAIIFIFEAIFLINYLKNRTYIAAIFLSFAAAMKFYPAFLAIIFLKNRQFKEFALCTFSTVFISLFSMAIFNNGSFIENINDFIQGLKDFNKFYMLSDDLNSNGLSFFLLIKSILMLMSLKLSQLQESTLKILLISFSSFCIISYSLVSYYIFKFEKILWKQLMLIISSSLVFFNVSYDYKMISLLLPIFLYLNDKNKYKFDRFYIWGFTLLLIPKQIAIKNEEFDYILLSNFFNLGIIISFIITIIIEGKRKGKINF